MTEPLPVGQSAPAGGPLGAVGSIKLKLALLVGISVALSAVVVALGSRGGLTPLITIPVAVGVALVVTQVLASGMTVPLRQLAAAAKQMASGDYSARVQPSTTDEVGQLVSAFNKMARDLESVDRGRRELVANVSHELRTPLTAVSASLENLADGVVEPTPARLAAVHQQTQRLAGLVADLLDLSRVDAGLAPLDLTEESIAELIAAAVDEVSGLGRAVTFELSEVDTRLRARVDRERFVQLVVGLLDNASRHSPTDGVVRVSSRATASGWALEIIDQGPGLAPAERERVFERYGTGAAAGGGGTGLGLAIARWIVHLHHGSIAFVDPEPGASGARLRMEWPTAVEVPATAPSPQSQLSEPPAVMNSGWAWPDLPGATGAAAVGAAALVGVLGGTILPQARIGVGLVAVLLCAVAVVVWWARDRGQWFNRCCFAASGLLLGTLMLRDADWLNVVSLLAGIGMALIGATSGSRLLSFVQAGIAWPLAGIRGLPWLGRVLARGMAVSPVAARLLRAAIITVAVVVASSLLFASGDAVFSRWVSGLWPTWELTELVNRTIIAVFIGGATLGATYLAMTPPTEVPEPWRPQPWGVRAEWLTPLVGMAAVYAVFVAAQGAALFGGEAYVRRTTGLTYAQYVHEGFGQMVVATLFALLAIWVVTRVAPTESRVDRLWLRAGVGGLGLLTLLIVASALHRMDAYQNAYGFTVLRLLVDVFIGWLGVVVVLVLVLPLVGKSQWISRSAVLAGAATLLAFNAFNPEAYIAHQNLTSTNSEVLVDYGYLGRLSMDAAQVLVTDVSEPFQGCVAPFPDELGHERRLNWNWSRWQGRKLWRAAEVSRGDTDFALCTGASLPY